MPDSEAVLRAQEKVNLPFDAISEVKRVTGVDLRWQLARIIHEEVNNPPSGLRLRPAFAGRRSRLVDKCQVIGNVILCQLIGNSTPQPELTNWVADQRRR